MPEAEPRGPIGRGPGARCLVPGTWCLVPGAWCLVLGLAAWIVQYPARMDEATASLASAIGERVRAERLSRRWTLDELANAAGVSRRMVVSVEQGAVNPSVGTLLRLSAALGVGLPALVEAPESRPVKVARLGQGAVLWNGENGGSGILMASTDLRMWSSSGTGCSVLVIDMRARLTRPAPRSWCTCSMGNSRSRSPTR